MCQNYINMNFNNNQIKINKVITATVNNYAQYYFVLPHIQAFDYALDKSFSEGCFEYITELIDNLTLNINEKNAHRIFLINYFKFSIAYQNIENFKNVKISSVLIEDIIAATKNYIKFINKKDYCKFAVNNFVNFSTIEFIDNVIFTKDTLWLTCLYENSPPMQQITSLLFFYLNGLK